jgi:hypothetical protein
MIAWRHSIADRWIIEEQFAYLVNDSAGHHALEKVRKATASGRKPTYPSLETFINHLRANSIVPAPVHDPLGAK